MRKWFVFFIFLIRTLNAQWKWSDPIEIHGGVAPDMDIDRKTGRLHIITMENGAVYTKADSLGTILEQGVVPGSGGDIGGWTFGAGVAVDPSGNPHVCYRIPNSYWFSTYYISRTGTQWGPSLQLSSDVYRGYMVRLSVDGSNQVHVVRTNGYSDNTGGIVYYRIANGTVNKILMWDQDYTPDLRLEIQATPAGLLHVVAGCPKTPDGSIFYYRSNDGGASINSYGDIHSPQCPRKNESPDLFADIAGNVHICYGTQRDGQIGYYPSIRYVRFENNNLVRDVTVTKQGDLSLWDGDDGWGICSIAATDSGQNVMVAYTTKEVGNLFTVLSTDAGLTWNIPVKMTSTADARPRGRARPVLRAYRNHFYLLYAQTSDTLNEDPRNCRVFLRHLRNYGDLAPVADADGPYSGQEGVPILLDGTKSIDPGANPGVVQYSWDVNNDGKYEMVSNTAQVPYTFPDNYSGKIVLQVKDRTGQTGTSQTTVFITNVPPRAEAGPNRTCNEGESLTYTGTGTDVPRDTLTYLWSFGNNQIELGQTVKHSFVDEGMYKVVLVVMDENGGIGRDSLAVTVRNVNPIADAGGPYVSPISESVQLNGSATDPGILDALSYDWDLNGDGIFETSGQQVTKMYTALGRYIVWLRVTDGDGGVGVDTASVTIVSDRPVIGKIPNQTVAEGKDFAPVVLDDWVRDPFYKATDLTWTVLGNRQLKVGLKNRILTVAVSDSEWFGAETLTLTVVNPKSAFDSTKVVFTVTAVNDAPRWIRPVPNCVFDEDSSTTIPLDSLRSRVRDVDNPITDLVFSLTGNTSVRWSLNTGRTALVLTAVHNWHGQERVSVVVTDKGGLNASSPCLITVRSVPDMPSPFSLTYPLYYARETWPDTIRFRWRRTVDNDTVGGMVYYEWIIADQATIQAPLLKQFVMDTAWVFTTNKTWNKNTYFWWVVGYTAGGLSVKSDNMGILVIGKSNVTDVPEALPTEFALLQNYPNPFNPETRITYRLPKTCRVRLSVFDPLGREVLILEEGIREAGTHTIVWNGSNPSGQKLPSGLYLCRFQAGPAVYHRKMVIMQ